MVAPQIQTYREIYAEAVKFHVKEGLVQLQKDSDHDCSTAAETSSTGRRQGSSPSPVLFKYTQPKINNDGMLSFDQSRLASLPFHLKTRLDINKVNKSSYSKD